MIARIRQKFFTCSAALASASAISLPAVADHLQYPTGVAAPRWVFSMPDCIPSCSPDDRARLLDIGAVERPALDAIEGAQQSIDFAQFTFSRAPIFEALLRAEQRGVTVSGLVDRGQFAVLRAFCVGAACRPPAPFDSDAYAAATLTERRRIAEGEALYRDGSVSERLALLLYRSPNGSEVRPLGGERLAHHKLVIADDERLVTGSGNWSSTAASINLETVHATDSTRDPSVVASHACAFDAMWGASQDRTRKLAACRSTNAFFAPVPSGARTATDDLLSLVQASRRTIDVSMHHLVHPRVIDALEDAAKRGVTVRLTTDDDHCVTRMTPEMRSLVSAGAEIRYVPTSCEMFQLAHNKFGVFDGKSAMVGSGNWSKGGLERNFESFIVVRDSADVAALTAVFERTWTRAVERQECACDPTTATCRKRYCLDRPRS